MNVDHFRVELDWQSKRIAVQLEVNLDELVCWEQGGSGWPWEVAEFHQGAWHVGFQVIVDWGRELVFWVSVIPHSTRVGYRRS